MSMFCKMTTDEIDFEKYFGSALPLIKEKYDDSIIEIHLQYSTLS